MTSKEALKRLWQETAPATYMPDFDKKECCDVIERDLEVLEIFKKYITIFEDPNTVEKFRYVYTSSYLTKEEYDLLKEWLENETNDNTI